MLRSASRRGPAARTAADRSNHARLPLGLLLFERALLQRWIMPLYRIQMRQRLPHRRFDGGRSCRAGPQMCGIVKASLHDEHIFSCARGACLLAQHDVIYALYTLPVRKHSEAGTHSLACFVESPTERSV